MLCNKYFWCFPKQQIWFMFSLNDTMIHFWSSEISSRDALTTGRTDEGCMSWNLLFPLLVAAQSGAWRHGKGAAPQLLHSGWNCSCCTYSHAMWIHITVFILNVFTEGFFQGRMSVYFNIFSNIIRNNYCIWFLVTNCPFQSKLTEKW